MSAGAPEVVALSERVQGGSVELPLSDDEFAAYVCALRNYVSCYPQSGQPYNSADWQWRAKAFEALRVVQYELHADDIDTAHLRACLESRRTVLDDREPYQLRLAGPLGRLAVLALDEFAWNSDPGELQAVAAQLLKRIGGAVAA